MKGLEELGSSLDLNLHHENWNRYIETLEIFRELNLLPTAKILDIGCGVGYLTLAIHQLGYCICGVDNDIQVSFTLNSKGVDVYPCNIERDPLPFKPRTFDCAIFAEVLEHINPREVLRVFNKIQIMLKDGGILLITTPNQGSLQNIFRLLLGKRIIFAPDHVREYVMEEVEEFMIRTDFKILIKKFTTWFDRPIKRWGMKTFIFRYILYPLKFLIPNLRSSFIIVAIKEENQ